jgi:hypothetical protein
MILLSKRTSGGRQAVHWLINRPEHRLQESSQLSHICGEL